jgi:hypothetical protein
MPINSPDIFNSVGDATVSGGTSGTVTEVDAGTGLETSPASGIVTTGTIGIADTAVTAGDYKIGGGGFTVNAQGQITSATQGIQLENIEADISPTILNGNNVQLAVVASDFIFLPTSVVTVCTSGTGAEGQKGSINIYYGTANSATPVYTIADRMFGLSSSGQVRTTIGDANTSMQMSGTGVSQDLYMTSAVTFNGNWTGKIFITGVLFPVT